MKVRFFGLDIIRSVAIIMVLVAHGRHFFTPYVSEKIHGFYIFSLFGVNLFFVLSGFLIGQIVIRDVLPGSFGSLRTFYIRRWFRTLPLYFLILIILVLRDNFGTFGSWHIYHFIFLQNFITSEILFFDVAWTLSIEEWFYILSPLLFLLFLPGKYKREDIIKITLIGIMVILAIRVVLVYLYNPKLDPAIIKFIPLRFDALLIGVLLACVKIHYNAIYLVLSKKHIFIISNIVLIFITIYCMYLIINNLMQESIFMKTFNLLFTSILMALNIPFMENNSFIKDTLGGNKYLFPLFTKISIYSYSIYLIHNEILKFFMKYSFDIKTAIFYLMLALAVIYSVSGLLYRYYEKPIMDLREKFS